jgi:hypothetical protein
MLQTPTYAPEASPPEPPRPDVVDVIDRAALIENVINQIIVGYCKPRKAAWEFMWSVMLDTSVMALGAKIKVVMAVAHEMDFSLEKNALHRVIALRNAFAHHASNAHPVLAVGKTPEEDTSYLQFWVLESSGKISRVKRHEAFDEFNAAYRKARDSLVQLKTMVNERYPRSDA